MRLVTRLAAASRVFAATSRLPKAVTSHPHSKALQQTGHLSATSVISVALLTKAAIMAQTVL